MAGLPAFKDVAVAKSNSATDALRYGVLTEETVLVAEPSNKGNPPTTAVGAALITTGSTIPHLEAENDDATTPRSGGCA